DRAVLSCADYAVGQREARPSIHQHARRRPSRCLGRQRSDPHRLLIRESETMPVVTKITEQKRRANRRNVFLDGAFAFGVNLNVVARFRLREGMTLSAEQVREIEIGEVRQECFDQAMEYLSSRLH